MVSTDTQITLVFVCLAVVLWLASGTVTDDLRVQLAILLGVGVLAPIFVTEWRRRQESSS